MKSKKHSTAGIAALLFIQLILNLHSQAGQPVRITEGMPQLVRHGNVTQLYVDGKPFLIVGGELNNSTSSSLEYMKPLWQQAADLNFNTVLTPLSWELIEPEEGQFDFNLVDGLIKEARQDNMHFVFLWLASWKNGMSTYVPLWAKEHYKEYPRAKIQRDSTIEVFSAFSQVNMEADSKAFSALMKHIREFDGTDHTVLMMQVENEVGILGDSRDRSEIANAAFAAPVPKELMDYLVKNKEKLVPELKALWGKNGFQTSGNWENVFGRGEQCDEAFMAWNYARYVNAVTVAGKKEYPIPMYVNAWLKQREHSWPGTYPGGGPLPHVFDIWHAGAPSVDILAPDLYRNDFAYMASLFKRSGNPLFIPETGGGPRGAANVVYAVGQHNALGFSPFAIERSISKDDKLKQSYNMLSQLMPLIGKHQGMNTMGAVLLTKDSPSENIGFEDYIFHADLRFDPNNRKTFHIQGLNLS